jgi:hypothetical protein
MGSTLMGSAKQSGSAPLMTGEQSSYLAQALQGLGPQANEAFSQFIQPYDQNQFQGLFQQAFVDPALQQYEQQVMPMIQQRFIDAGAGSSSALNQALGQSAADLSTMLGSQMGQFYQGQQQNRLQALQGLTGMIGQRQFDPIIQQRQGILGPLIGAGGQMGAAGIMASSKHVKENVRDFDSGLDVITNMDVKQYDYKDDFVKDSKNKIGFIAEDMPEAIQGQVDGVLGVDVYGLLALSINAIKELSKKVELLEAK